MAATLAQEIVPLQIERPLSIFRRLGEDEQGTS
jgi:hypothetical protein